MKILFIRQPTNFTFPMIAAGMGTVATILHRAGHQVRVIDNNSLYRYYSDATLLRIVRKYDPDVVGFSITIVNALATYTLLQKMKKAFPRKIFIAGGMHAKRCFQEMLRHGIDIVVNREGEKVVLPLIAHLEGRTPGGRFEGLEDISGVSFFKGDGSLHEAREFPRVESLDEVPFVDYDLFNIGDFFKNGKEPAVILLNGQRGCPFRCTFCSDEDQRRDRRMASAAYMFDYVKYVHEKYGTSYIWIADNNFFVPRRRAAEFCEKMISSGLNRKVALVAQSKIESALDDDLLRLVKSAGFTKLGFGIERLDEYSQEMIQKKTSLERTHRILSLVKKNGINVSINVILGFPFDTVELVRKERDHFMGLRQYSQNFVTNVLTPVPGTIYYDDYPKAREWYLDPKVVEISRSYFGHVLDLAMFDALDINYFDLPGKVIDEIRSVLYEFKHINHGQHVVKKSLLLALSSKADLVFASLSKFIFRFSPKLEFRMFRKIKFLRYYLATLVFGNKVSNM
jgi:anaerobic magnesium-protoporphyrin IX monomethyl ester cyclase